MADTPKLQIPLTTAGLLKMFGGALETRPLSCRVKIGDLDFIMNDDANYTWQYAFEEKMADLVGTTPTPINILKQVPAGLDLSQVCDFYNQVAHAGTEYRVLTAEQVFEAHDEKQDLSNVKVQASAVNKTEARLLSSYGMRVEGAYWCLPQTTLELSRVQSIAESVVAELKGLTTVDKSKTVTAPVAQIRIGDAGLKLVQAMWRAGDEQIRHFNFGVEFEKLRPNERTTKWRAVREVLMKGKIAYNLLEQEMARRGMSSEVLTAVLIKNKGHLILDKEEIEIRKTN